MEIRAAVARAAGQPLAIETIRLEGPRAGEVLVEIKATGVCHTDAYTLSGADPEGHKSERFSAQLEVRAFADGRDDGSEPDRLLQDHVHPDVVDLFPGLGGKVCAGDDYADVLGLLVLL